MTSFHDVTKKNLSHNSYHIVDKVKWLKFGKSNISKGEVIITSILWGFDQKYHPFSEVVLVQVQ